MSEWGNGRPDRFRIYCRKACRFESDLGHKEDNTCSNLKCNIHYYTQGSLVQRIELSATDATTGV